MFHVIIYSYLLNTESSGRLVRWWRQAAGALEQNKTSSKKIKKNVEKSMQAIKSGFGAH